MPGSVRAGRKCNVITMPFLRAAAGAVLYCESLGKGPPVLFMTGSDSDLRGHHEVTPFVFGLVEAFSVIAYDPRGLGSSPPLPEAPSMADFAEDARQVLDAFGIERAGVIGYSFGGMTAQELALRHPERIERMVLLGTSSGGAGGSSYPLHELRSLPKDERRRRSLELWDLRCGPSWREERPDEFRAAIAELERIDAAAAEPSRARGMSQQLEARRHHDTYERLSTLLVPTLVVGGRFDGVAPRSNQESLARRIPGAALRMFEGGHRVLWQDPGAIGAIVSFLAGGEIPPES